MATPPNSPAVVSNPSVHYILEAVIINPSIGQAGQVLDRLDREAQTWQERQSHVILIENVDRNKRQKNVSTGGVLTLQEKK